MLSEQCAEADPARGIAQAIGQVIQEKEVHGNDGLLLPGSTKDHAIPTGNLTR